MEMAINKNPLFEKIEYDITDEFVKVYDGLKKEIIELMKKNNIEINDLISRLNVPEDIFYDYMVNKNYKNFAVYLDTIATIENMQKEVENE